MRFDYGYLKGSAIRDSADSSAMSFAPDLNREPTYFRGELARVVEFREAISTLHDVVISDLRWKPKDRTAYKAWLENQELVDMTAVFGQKAQVAARVETLSRELGELRRGQQKRMAPFYRARQKYFDYLYRRDYDAWFVLDPVITVHPDELFFECFSQDESTYGRLSADLDVFKNVGEFACGTTNIDYSDGLYNEFQKLRSYKTTAFDIDPTGFEVETTNEETYKEVKIDLPDSWVRGFLQVSSAMALPATRFELHPMDLHNFCLVLRRNRELKGPRSMRYLLTPGQPVKVIFEPWNLEVVCGRSIYTGGEAQEIRIWGRRRLHILERLIPIARSFEVHLLGTGLPSFFVARLGGNMTFTLGLSGWTANDWSTAGNFDLMAPRATVDDLTKTKVFDALKQNWYEQPDKLADRLKIDRALVLGALSAYTQAGRAIFDLAKGVFRVRELARDPLPMASLRFANEREAEAQRLVDAGEVKCRKSAKPDGAVELSGTVGKGRRRQEAQLLLDSDQRMIQARCTCNFYQQNKLYKGPCEHILALRLGREQKFTFQYFLKP